ncbi:MAG: nucleoside recognition domain-containing protein, partial [Candidatus Berkiella sp.]
MNLVFFFLIFSAYCACAWQQWYWTPTASSPASPMHSLGDQLLHGASDAVTLAIGLVGVLALFMGLMKIIEESGLLQNIAKCLYPILKKLFPEVPANHPAFGAMVMNFSANMLGMGNAATPFGLKAMQELDKLNTQPGVATNAMVLFLAMNTACITLLPAKIIALRASAGSSDPAGIITTTLVATLCSTIMAVLVAKLLQRLTKPVSQTLSINQNDINADDTAYPIRISILALASLFLLIPIMLLWGKILSPWIMPSLIVAVLGFGLL